MEKNNKGFTLIELLVVIAIIGILASVVLASLNSARNKGADAAIKADLTNVRAQNELFYDSNSSQYAKGTGITSAVTACPSTIGTNSATNFSIINDPNTFNAVTQASSQTSGSNCGYWSTAATWAISVRLKTADGGGAGNTLPDAWCVDSTGQGKTYTYASGTENALSAISVTTGACI